MAATVADAMRLQAEVERSLLPVFERSKHTPEQVAAKLRGDPSQPIHPKDYAKERSRVRDLLQEFFTAPCHTDPSINGPWRSHVYTGIASARKFYRNVFIDDYPFPAQWAPKKSASAGGGGGAEAEGSLSAAGRIPNFAFIHPSRGNLDKQGWTELMMDVLGPSFPDLSLGWELENMNDWGDGGEGHVRGTWSVSGTHTGAPLCVGDHPPLVASGARMSLPRERIRVRVVDLHVCEIRFGWDSADEKMVAAAEPEIGELVYSRLAYR